MAWKKSVYGFVVCVVLMFLLLAPAGAEMLFLEGEWEQWGEMENLVYSQEHEGSLQLAGDGNGYVKEGVFTTKVLTTDEVFINLVPSWNILTPGETYAIVEVKVKIADEVWTDWQVLGIWGQNIDSRSITLSSWFDGYPYKINIDIFQVLHDEGARQYQIRTILMNPSGDETPVLQGLGATKYGVVEGDVEVPSGWARELPVPMRSQMVEKPDIRGRICSPVSLAMVLEYFGHNESSESVAYNSYDHGARLFGNWSFNVAYAGSLGYRAYVDHFDSLDEMKVHIARGVPVIASIRFGQGQLQNSPIASTAGHLVVVTGFKVDSDGTKWVIVNDPAAPDNETVRREYLAHEFERAWVGIVYIVEERY